MNPGQTARRLLSPEAVVWVKDHDQVCIINEQQRTSHVLRGEEALVWGWLVSAYSYSKIIRLLKDLLAIPTKEAEKTIQTILEKWRLAGLLEVETGENGQPDCD